MLKDYYKTLGLQPAATAQEVKNAFRALAAKYHPDKAAGNPFAESHFKEIAEAYGVLADNQKRYAYDEERWLRGISHRAKDKIRISPEWLLAEAHKLEMHMQSIDRYRMNHAALRDYALLLLSDEHMSIWKAEAAPEQGGELLQAMLAAIQSLRTAYYKPVSIRLAGIFNKDQLQQDTIYRALRQKIRTERWEQAFPFIVLLAAVLICLLIALLKR